MQACLDLASKKYQARTCVSLLSSTHDSEHGGFFVGVGLYFLNQFLWNRNRRCVLKDKEPHTFEAECCHYPMLDI